MATSSAKPRPINTTMGPFSGDEPHPSPLASHPYILPPQNFSSLDIPHDLQISQSRPLSTATRTSYLGGDLHGVLMDEDENDARDQSRDDVRALIEFFKNTAPPESSFMSKPYENEDDRGRWSTLKGISKRRSKSMSRAAQPIRLPDSAVSGTTTGGHRHIAISIPIEASPFGERPRSQYPVYPDYDIHNDIPPVPTPPKQVIRTYVNDKGVITVMRAVADEHDETPGNDAPLASPPVSATSSRPPSQHRSFSRPQSQQSKSNVRTTRRDTASPPPPPLADRPQMRHRSRTVSFEDTKGGGADSSATPPLPSPSSEFSRTAYPARASSMAATRRAHRPADSIDSIISHGYQDRNPSPIPPSSKPQRRGVARRPGTREGPPVSLATSPIGRKSNPNLRGERQPEERLSFEPVKPTKRASNVTIITDTPVVTRLDDSPPLTPVSAVTRKDKVRDKKRRDLEAARLARDSKLQSQFQPDDDETPGPAVPEKDVPSSGPKLTGIMVVVDVVPDVEPDVGTATVPEPESESVPELESESESKPESIIEDEIVQTEVPDRETQSPSPQPSELNLDEPGPLVCTGNPTPPDSTKNSPAQRFGFDDRTSLTRRREWNASREQERKRREAEKVNAKAKQLAAAGMSYERIKALNPEEKMVKLYEAYREHRMLDIDRRLRRLERNGDVWIQALLPLLDNMNRNMEAMNSRHEDDMLLRDCASDDEASASLDKLDRKLERRRLTRRASLSEGRMLEELSRREKAASWNNADDGKVDDASGLGALDSIMRELAAESRFGKSGMQSFSGHDGVFAN